MSRITPTHRPPAQLAVGGREPDGTPWRGLPVVFFQADGALRFTDRLVRDIPSRAPCP